MARMLVLFFDGWFQCRLPTNPDPSDEPRGVSGFTFALAGEPDLDRVIRLHDPLCPRSHGPEIGVFVRDASMDGVRIGDHPLVGARIDLLDEPKFESRNQLLTDDRAGTGLIEPFHFAVTTDGVRIVRSALLFPDDVSTPLLAVPAPYLNRRAPVDPFGYTLDPLRIAQEIKILSPAAYRANRKRLLEADLAASHDPVERTALKKRIEELEMSDPANMRILTMIFTQTRRFELDGHADVTGFDRLTDHPSLDTSKSWSIEFWMGGWDADALSGYMSGRLALPCGDG